MLARETLQDLWLLKADVDRARAEADKARDDGISGNLARLRRRRDRAVTKFREALHRHADPLLLAAERGLGAGDGR